MSSCCTTGRRCASTRENGRARRRCSGISFIRDLTTREDGAAIAVAIITMARSLHMRVIAEGVETQPQLDWLRQNACDEIQGFLYSRPLPVSDLVQRRQAHRAATPSFVLAPPR